MAKEVEEIPVKKNGVDYSKITFEEAEKKANEINERNQLDDVMLLKRIRVSSNDPNKRNLDGEIICVRNKFTDTIKKFVPFNKDTHVPQMLYNVLKEKKCQVFKTEYINGHAKVTPYQIDAYNIIDLPPITHEQFEAIRQHQLAEGVFGE